jgi:hypothetical protein
MLFESFIIPELSSCGTIARLSCSCLGGSDSVFYPNHPASTFEHSRCATCIYSYPVSPYQGV